MDAEDDTDTPQREHESERDRTHASLPRRRVRSRSVRFGAGAAAVLTVLLLVSAFVVQPFVIPSSSMAPTLQAGDRVLVNKLAYQFGNSPQRGDVVVFDGRGSFVPGEETDGGPIAGFLRAAASVVGLESGTVYVKRVIGVGGDRVRCCDKRGRIQVNGRPLEEEYLHPGDVPSSVPFDIRVPKGRLWVMGDHRSRSSDSRDHLGQPGGGTVPVERVIGRVDWIGWPPDRWSTVAEEIGETGPDGAAPRAGGRG